MMSDQERIYVECQTCCSAVSSSNQWAVDDWADNHEHFNPGHKVKSVALHKSEEDGDR